LKAYLLDTNICIFYLNDKHSIGKKIKEVGIANCFTSEITIAELKYGAECSRRREQNRALVEDFTAKFKALPIFDTFDIYAKEKARLRKLGTLIDDFDLLIGSTALFHNLVMVTDNVEHLGRLEGITIENWTKATA